VVLPELRRILFFGSNNARDRTYQGTSKIRGSQSLRRSCNIRGGECLAGWGSRVGLEFSERVGSYVSVVSRREAVPYRPTFSRHICCIALLTLWTVCYGSSTLCICCSPSCCGMRIHCDPNRSSATYRGNTRSSSYQAQCWYQSRANKAGCRRSRQCLRDSGTAQWKAPGQTSYRSDCYGLSSTRRIHFWSSIDRHMWRWRFRSPSPTCQR